MNQASLLFSWSCERKMCSQWNTVPTPDSTIRGPLFFPGSSPRFRCCGKPLFFTPPKVSRPETPQLSLQFGEILFYWQLFWPHFIHLLLPHTKNLTKMSEGQTIVLKPCPASSSKIKTAVLLRLFPPLSSLSLLSGLLYRCLDNEEVMKPISLRTYGNIYSVDNKGQAGGLHLF